MNTENSEKGGKEVLIVLGIGGLVLLVIGLIYLLTIMAVLAVIAATGASVFYGVKLAYKIAMKSEVWESRRIAQHKKLEVQLQREAGYFRAKGYSQIAEFVEGQHDDKVRELYKDKHPLDDTLNTVKKLKEVFKK